MDTLDTFLAGLKADARADQRERQRQLWQATATPGGYPDGYSVLMGADLRADTALRGEVWDNAPEVWGAPSASDYRGDGYVPLPNGRKREVLPFA